MQAPAERAEAETETDRSAEERLADQLRHFAARASSATAASSVGSSKLMYEGGDAARVLLPA